MSNRHPSMFFPLVLMLVVSPPLARSDGPTETGISPEADKVLDRMIERIRQLKSYADEAIVETRAPMGFREEPAASAFVFEKPDRFRVATASYDLCSDGKNFTVFSRNMKRYMVAPLEKDWSEKLKNYSFNQPLGIHVSDFFFQKDPKKLVAKQIERLDVTGEETVGGERCIVLSGPGHRPSMEGDKDRFGMDFDTEFRMYLRKSDGMLRRIEQVQKMKFSKQETDEDSDTDEPSSNIFSGFFGGDGLTTTHTYDIINIHLDERPTDEAFVFKPSQGAKKVDRFYRDWHQDDQHATQFDLSGRPAPDFELSSLEGSNFNLGQLRGKVGVLVFGHAPMEKQADEWIKNVEKLARLESEFADQDAKFIYIIPGHLNEEARDAVKKADLDVTVLLDEDQGVQFAYFEDDSTTGKVLLNNKSVVQGRYTASMEDDALSALRGDVQRLIKGESLPSGEPMSDEEIAEMDSQRMLQWSQNADEPVNENFLKLAWTVRARSEERMNMPMRNRQLPPGRLWITDKDVVRLISSDGEGVAEFKLPERESDRMSVAQDDFTIGRFGNEHGLIHVKDLAPINFASFGAGIKKREKGFEVRLISEGGKEAWTLELPPSQFQGPADLQAADLNADRVDEIIFTHADSLWIVNARGDVVVRKPFRDFGGWVRALDLDRDGKGELYLLCDGRLQRYDYEPRR